MTNTLTRVGAAALLALTATMATAQETPTYNLIDFVVLNDGAQIAERSAYEETLEPIAARHGAEVIHSYDIAAHLAGPMEDSVRLNVWQFADPATLGKVNNDPDYAEIIPERDRVHDLDRLTLYMAQPIVDGGRIEDGVILVDLVVLNDGFEAEDRDAYEAKMAPIAAKYGFTIHSAFALMQKIDGEGPAQASRLNLWTGQDRPGWSA